MMKRKSFVIMLCVAMLFLANVCFAETPEVALAKGTDIESRKQLIIQLLSIWDVDASSERIVSKGVSDLSGFEGLTLYSYEGFEFYFDEEKDGLAVVLKKSGDEDQFTESEFLSKADDTMELIYGESLMAASEKSINRYSTMTVSYDFVINDVAFSAGSARMTPDGSFGGLVFHHPQIDHYMIVDFMSAEDSFARSNEVVYSFLKERYLVDEDDIVMQDSSSGRKINDAQSESVVWYWKLDYLLNNDPDMVLSFQVTVDAVNGQLVHLATNASDVIGNGTVTPFVERLYGICLGRKSDEKGLASWCDVLEKNVAGGKKVAYGFFFSREFQNLELDDAEFVNRLYHAMLGREGERKGVEAWTNALKDGVTRLKVYNGFAKSVEFGNLCEEMGVNV